MLRNTHRHTNTHTHKANLKESTSTTVGHYETGVHKQTNKQIVRVTYDDNFSKQGVVLYPALAIT